MKDLAYKNSKLIYSKKYDIDPWSVDEVTFGKMTYCLIDIFQEHL